MKFLVLPHIKVITTIPSPKLPSLENSPLLQSSTKEYSAESVKITCTGGLYETRSTLLIMPMKAPK